MNEVLENPTPAEWDALRTIADNIDSIVDDSSFPTGQRSGLLLLPLLPNESTSTSGRLSRLAAEIWSSPTLPALPAFGPAFGHLAFRSVHEMVTAVLPGAAALGGAPAERLGNLRQHVRELPAYRWLMAHKNEAYRRALATMGKPQTDASYRDPKAEYWLLSAVIPALSAFQTASSYNARFPTRDEVGEALEHARALNRFLSGSVGLMWADKIKAQSSLGLTTLLADLTALQTWKRPQGGAVVELRREFLRKSIHNTRIRFAHVSASVLSDLCGLVDYRISRENVQAAIRAELGDEGLSKTRNKPGQRPIARDQDAANSSFAVLSTHWMGRSMPGH